ncbi:HlyD family secretion protein [Rhodobacter capsulatus]
MATLPVVLVLAGGWVWLDSGRYESTENAAVQQARISVASDISGRVTEVFVKDNDRVTSGQPLFRVDPEPYRIALAQADAALAQARLQVAQLRAAYNLAQAQEQVAQDTADYLASELKRQEAITGRGAGTESALDAARHDASSALESLAAAKQGVAAALAALGGRSEGRNRHPSDRDGGADRPRQGRLQSGPDRGESPRRWRGLQGRQLQARPVRRRGRGAVFAG